jgi:uncharacterized phiE125 gp8 family phage protein
VGVHLITAPASEPVTLAEAKVHLRLEHALDDSTVTSNIVAARDQVEQFTWRQLVKQTWELVLDGFPACGWVDLPKGHLYKTSPIISVKYLDPDRVLQTLADTEYEADAVSVPGKLRLADGKSWPSTRDTWNAVRIQYQVGWDVADVPALLKAAVLVAVAEMYEHRDPILVGTISSELPINAQRLARGYRLNRY